MRVFIALTVLLSNLAAVMAAPDKSAGERIVSRTRIVLERIKGCARDANGFPLTPEGKVDLEAACLENPLPGYKAPYMPDSRWDDTKWVEVPYEIPGWSRFLRFRDPVDGVWVAGALVAVKDRKLLTQGEIVYGIWVEIAGVRYCGNAGGGRFRLIYPRSERVIERRTVVERQVVEKPILHERTVVRYYYEKPCPTPRVRRVARVGGYGPTAGERLAVGTEVVTERTAARVAAVVNAQRPRLRRRPDHHNPPPPPPPPGPCEGTPIEVDPHNPFVTTPSGQNGQTAADAVWYEGAPPSEW